MHRLLAGFLLVAAGFAVAQDDKAVIREREHQFAQALQAKDKAALARLVDKDFQIDCSISGPVSSASASLGLDDLLRGLAGARMQEYRAPLTDVGVSPEFAVASLNEFWPVDSGVNQAERHFRTMDVWVKRDGDWKLAKRSWMVNSGVNLVHPSAF